MMFLLIVTIFSIAVALTMSIVAWRIAAQERRRSDARVAALAAEISAPVAAPRAIGAESSRVYRADAGLRAEPARTSPSLVSRPAARASAPDLFADPNSSGAPRFAVIALVCAIVASAVTAGVMIARDRRAGRAADTRAVHSAPESKRAAAQAFLPIELVALGHDRDGDRLTVRGVLRNPPSGARIDGLMAVVFAFDADGRLLSSGRAPIESSVLEPGRESTFLVVVPATSAIGRYRVSFRAGDQVVAHVDRREVRAAS